MKKNINGLKLAIVLLFSVLLFSCGGKSTTQEQTENAEEEPVVVDQTTPEPPSAGFMAEQPPEEEAAPPVEETAPVEPPVAETPVIQEMPQPVIQPKLRHIKKKRIKRKHIAPPPPSADEVLNQIFDNVHFDSLTFNAPSSMKQDEQASADLSVDTTNAKQQIRNIVDMATDKGFKDLVTAQLEARLTSNGFQIDSISADSQRLSLPGPLTWSWKLKPLSPGVKVVEMELRLHLSVNNQGDTARTVKTLDKTITVEAPPPPPVEEPKSYATWWIFLAILVILGAVATVLMRRRGAKT